MRRLFDLCGEYGSIIWMVCLEFGFEWEVWFVEMDLLCG